MNVSGLDQPQVSRVLVERYLDRLRRRRRWRRLTVTVTVFLLLITGTAYTLLWHTKIFDVRGTKVTGIKILTKEQILAAAAIPVHTPVAAIDTEAAKARIMKLPRVKNAIVERVLPHTIEITVVERVPAAALPDPDGSFTIVDSDGVAFDTAGTASAIPSRIPLIHFDPASDAAAVPGVDPAKQRARAVSGALAALRALPDPLKARVQDVSATGPYGITLRLTPSTSKQSQVTVVWGGGDQSDLKARILSILMAKGASHYDVSAPQAPAYS